MKIEWLSEASSEFRDYLLYYRNMVGTKYARKNYIYHIFGME